MNVRALIVSLVGLLVCGGLPAARAQEIELEPVVTGLTEPIAVAHAGDGSGRIFIAQQSGEIRIWTGETLLPTPFLDLSGLVSGGSEQGLLGLAFHPDYVSQGFFYVDYTDLGGDTVVARYEVSAGDPDVADPDSAQIVLTRDQPFSNHNGGQIGFGPDGYLYIALGDGGLGGDPQDNGQDLETWLGKLLRVDVDGDDFPGDPSRNYAVPSDNPFVGVDGLDEIWAYGLRNPWRFSFDRQTGDLWIGDVGQGAWEEIDLQPAASEGGENYGWDVLEGAHCFEDDPGGDGSCADFLDGGSVLPVLEYGHSLGCSVTGGYRYRGELEPQLTGIYFYADFCSRRIWGALPQGGDEWESQELLIAPLSITTFGEDEAGEIYVAQYTGTAGQSALHRIVAVGGQGEPVLTADPDELDFGATEVGTTSPPQMVTVQNIGDADATGLTFDVSDEAFDVDSSDCGTTLPADASCEILVTFTPLKTGPVSATLEVGSTEGASAAVALAGNGISDLLPLTPVGLEADPESLVSDGNGVFEPGEFVEVAPAWRNDGTMPQSPTGTAADFTGPEGAVYTLLHDNADYGTLDPGESGSCLATGACYQMGVNDPVVRPATHWEATFDETLSDDTAHTWTLHIGESFVDVPSSNLFYPSVETLLHHGVTGGCTGSEYCPTAANTRDQMPVFVLRALEGAGYEPPACVEGAEVFHDVPASNVFCPWIEELANRDVVSGCGGDNYCPNAPVTRAQMAIFLLRTLEGSGYTPPACTGMFVDVPCPSLFADWIEDLFAREITGGCGSEPLRYCPASPVNREQMAAFIGKAFELTLYGP